MPTFLPPQNRDHFFAQQNSTLVKSPETTPLKNLPIIGDLPLLGQLMVITGLSVGLIGGSIAIAQIMRKSFKGSSYINNLDSKKEQKIQNYLQKDLKSLSWYDQPRWAQKSAFQHFLKSVYQPSVPDGVIFLHCSALDKISPLAQKITEIDDEKFKGKEFITYLKIRTPYEDGPNRDDDLSRSAELLKVALATSSYFDQIWQVEFRYISSKQKEYYKFVDNLLTQKVHGDIFRQKLYAQLDIILPDVISEEGQNVLKSYVEALSKLSENELGLELLSLFKQYKLADFVVLKTISQLFGILKKEDLADEKVVLAEVIKQFSAFERLAPIIQMPVHKASPEDFANLVHFCVLELKHRASYAKFDKLMNTLNQWLKHHQVINQIRAEYDPKCYRLPEDFCTPIPGLKIYEKYIMWMLP